MTDRPRLRALAERAGILSSYVDLGGKERQASDPTRERLLRAMGLEAGSEEEAGRELEKLDAADRERVIEPVRVAPQSRGAATVPVRLPAAGVARWTVEIVEEGGRAHVREGRSRGAAGATRRLRVPVALPPGYHRVRCEVRTAAGARAGEALLAVVPRRCADPLARTGGRRAFGVIANLYTLRSAANWGVGDLADLRELARASAGRGAAFVGVNPLHALRNRGSDVSPYGPVSRLYRNVLYLRIDDVPELAESPDVRARLDDRAVRAALDRLRGAARVPYEDALEARRPLLAALHAVFAAHHRGQDTPRGRAYAAWLAREGEPLEDFATFCAIEERLVASGVPPGGWREWPEAFRDPRGAGVKAFRDEHAEAVDLHRWMQFELDRQLAAAAEAGRVAGLAVGIYQDLAIGTSAGGSDPWAFPELFVEGVSVGAPPDDFSAQGQTWGLPPVNPHRLRADGYRYWVRLLRSAFAHAGALRIDHVMGLWRQFWVPAGRPGSEGAYVRYPAEDLVGLLALESDRHAAAVVGEDLGTVPEGLRAELATRRILSSRVLPFEREGRAFRSAASYPRGALVSANTHDLPPLAGWWSGQDLELRRAVGHLTDDATLEAARRERQEDRTALRERLAADGAGELPPQPTYAALCGAVHTFLARTPSALAGAALDDLAAETDPVNLPGVPLERYGSWSRRMRTALEDVFETDAARLALDALRRDRGTAP